MAACVVDQTQDVVIIERIERLPARATHPDQPRATQQAQLMRHSRLGQSHQGRQVADAAFAMTERIDHPHTCRITQQPEDVGHGPDCVCGQKPRSNVGKRDGVTRPAIAAGFAVGQFVGPGIQKGVLNGRRDNHDL